MRLTIFLSLISFFASAQNITINGSGSTLPINAVSQVSSVSLVVPTVPEFFDSQSGDIDFEDEHFSMSYPSFTRNGYQNRVSMSYLDFETEERQITFKIIGNWANQIFQSYLSIHVNGVYDQSISLTTDDVEEQKTVVLPAGLKTVRLTNGYNAALSPFNQSVVYADAINNFKGIITDSSFRIKRPVRPLIKYVAVGTSITSGGGANVIPASMAWVSLLRYDDDFEIGNFSWGGKIVQTTTVPLADSMANIISTLMDARTANYLIPDVGTNDYGIHNKTKAAFKADYERFVDAVIRRRPDITLYCISLPNRTNYDSGNGVGAVGDDYYDAMIELAVTRHQMKVIRGKDLVTFPGNVPDGVHWNEAGHAEGKVTIKAAIEALQ